MFSFSSTLMALKLCYVIVTCRTLIWTLLSLMSSLAITAAVVSPQWLLGEPPEISSPEMAASADRPTSILYIRRRGLGLFNKCGMYPTGQAQQCATYIKPLAIRDFPLVWKVCLGFAACSVSILFSAIGGALASLCVRHIFKKSIFYIMGIAQAMAGMFSLLALMLFPMGWGSPEVQDTCGLDARPFILGHCTIGWSFYAFVAGSALGFIAAVLAVQAHYSISDDKIQDEMRRGQNLICAI